MAFELFMSDWNGTLFNDVGISHVSTAHVLKQTTPYENALTFEEYRREFCASNIMECYYRRGVPRSFSREEVYAMWESHYATMCGRALLHDGAIEMLSFFKSWSVPTVIISAAPAAAKKHVIACGIEGLISDMQFDKDDKAEAILETLHRYNVHPRDALYLDDSAHCIVQAKSTGVATVGFTRGISSLAHLLDVGPLWSPVDHLDDVRKIAYAQCGS
jgi:phosphoglycolate phosphatase-like HAD superfamily hydrolase